MNFIKVNLLPYREMAEAKQKKIFNAILGVGAIAGVVLAGMVFFTLSEMLDGQNQRNQTLQEGIDKLKKDLETIQTLEKRKHDFLVRKNKVEELDNKRFEGARIMDGLNQLVPEGVYLTNVKGELNNVYRFEGKALSDQKVAVFMSSLPSTGVFDQPTLISITTDEEAKAQNFVLTAKLVEQKFAPPPASPAPAASAAQ